MLYLTHNIHNDVSEFIFLPGYVVVKVSAVHSFLIILAALFGK